MRVHWTDAAIKNLVAVYEYIADDSPYSARTVVDRLTRRSEQLAIFPESGRIVPEYGRPDIRELIEYSYRILYRIKPHQVDILNVVHGAKPLAPDSLG